MSNEQVFVTNRNRERFVDKYNGQEFVMEPGQDVLMPVGAARHIFGMGAPAVGPVLARLGKSFRFDPETKKVVDCSAEGVAWLKNFVFTPAIVRKQTEANAAPLW